MACSSSPSAVLHNGFGRQHVGAEMLVEALQPCGGVRRVAHDAVQEAAAAASVPDIDVAVLEPDPRLEVARSMFLGEPVMISLTSIAASMPLRQIAVERTGAIQAHMIISARNSITSTPWRLSACASASKYSFMNTASSCGDFDFASAMKSDMSVARQVPKTTRFSVVGSTCLSAKIAHQVLRQVVADGSRHLLLLAALEQVLAHQPDQQRRAAIARAPGSPAAARDRPRRSATGGARHKVP